MGLLEKMPILESSIAEEAKKGAGTAVSGIFSFIDFRIEPFTKRNNQEYRRGYSVSRSKGHERG